VAARIRPARILWEQFVLPAAARRARLEVMLNPGFTAPALCPCPCVTVFHDLQHKRHPEFFRWFDLPFWRLLLWQSAHTSALLLADSEATRADLLRYYQVPERKVRVAPLGVSERFFELGRHRAPDGGPPYVLAISTLHPHKNLDRLVRAFAIFRRSLPEYRLVIAGMYGFYTEPLRKRIAELGLEDCVRLTGWIPQQELDDLYRKAAFFIHPALFEGFGLPVVEALAAGVPAACSNIEPLRSIVADAALTFDPSSEEAIAQAMLRLARDERLREQLSAAGPLRARRFSWKRTAEITLEALREAAAPASVAQAR
jgi:glycosyltransferase involved in cell wall biosynthesis